MSQLHLIGFPHTSMDDPGAITCAYTQKVRKFIDMGWGDRLQVYTANVRRDPEDLPVWPDDRQWRRFLAKVMPALRKNADTGDLLLLAGGYSQRDLIPQFPELVACEPGVGYSGIITDHCAFESHAWQHYVYGLKGWDGRPFDTVIPNFFDPAEFPYVNDGQGDYLLFMGRVITRKGPHVAVEVAERAGLPLYVAGPVSPEIDVSGQATMLGVLQPDERAKIMAGAAAVIVPTLYIEPFGGVAVEAMLCGTPVVASDWGAMVETVEEGVTGYRFRTLQEGADAVEMARTLDPTVVRARALERYSLDAVKPRYDYWFGLLDSLWEDGYYTTREASVG